jgi:hypothetical protein
MAVSNKALRVRVSCFRSGPSTSNSAPLGLFRFHPRQKCMNPSLSGLLRLETSAALVYQYRSADKTRAGQYVGELSTTDLTRLEGAVRQYLGF